MVNDSNEYLIKFSRQLLDVGIITKEEYDKVLKSLIVGDKRLINIKKIIEEDIDG